MQLKSAGSIDREREARSIIGGTLFPNGVPDILRIFRTRGTQYPRINCAGVHKSGDAKYPMTPGPLLAFEVTDGLRLPESLSPPLTIAFFSPYLTLETYCANANGSPCDVTYDRAHYILSNASGCTRTHTIFDLDFCRNYCEKKSRKILASSTQPKVQEQPIK